MRLVSILRSVGNHFKHARRQSRTGRRKSLRSSARLSVQPLEERQLLSGIWQPVGNGIAGYDTMLLLSDGSIMAHTNGCTSYWTKLTPDRYGDYAHVTATGLASMSIGRQYFSSDVLPDGRVLVLGGEYTGNWYGSAQTETNTGEIYDPTTNSWSAIANFPQDHFGDGPTEVLPDGRVLAGWLDGSATYIYDPSSNTWSAGGSLLYGDKSAEEGWVKLPGNSILTYEISGNSQQTGQRYLSGSNQWLNAGSVPVQLASNGGNAGIVPEIGPGVLLANNYVFWAGASGHTALYNTVTGTWVTGPDIPGGFGAFDAPGAVEANGKVLFAAGPINGTTFPGPTAIMEYDPLYDTISQVPTPPGLNLSGSEFTARMLDLPSGQILFTTSSQLYLYNPDSNPDPSWAPTISSIVNNGDGSFTLTGTQLNGISEGATYGDDGEMASNYPLVRLISPDGTVQYTRTFHWSSTDVQTGSTPVSTQFTLPTGVTDGAYLVQAVANGIASQPMLCVFTSATDNNITLRRDPSGPSGLYQVLDSGTSLGSFSIGLFNAVEVITDPNGGNINIQDTLAGVPLTVNGGGYDQIVIGNNGSVQGIQGNVFLQDPPSFNALTIDDSADTAARTATISTSNDGVWGSITGLAPASINYKLFDTTSPITINGGPANGNQFTIAGGAVWQAINLNAGAGNDTVNVLATRARVNIDGGGGYDAIYVGTGDVSGITGDVNVVDTGGMAGLVVNDSYGSANRTVSVFDGSLIGLAPATISWTPGSTGTGGVTSLSLVGGTGNSIYTVVNSSNFGPDGYLLVQAGHGSASSNIVNIEATQCRLYVDGRDSLQQVLIGSNAPTVGGTLAGIQAGITVYNYSSSGATSLTVDDSQDTTARTALLYADHLVGLSPAPIYWIASPSGVGGVTELNILGTSAGSTYDVVTTPAMFFGTGLNTGTGNDAVNIQATAGPLYVYNDGGSDAVVIGSKAPTTTGGTVAGIAGMVNVGGSGSTSLVVDDSGDTTARTATLISYQLIGLSPQPIIFAAGVTSLTVNGGTAADTYNLESTSSTMSTTLNAGPASDTFLVCPTLPSLDQIAGPLTIYGGGGTNNTLTVYDSATQSDPVYTLIGDSNLTRTGAAPISYSGMHNVTIDGGTAAVSEFIVSALPIYTTVTLNGAAQTSVLAGPNASETWTISGLNAGSLGSKLLFTGMQYLEGGTGNDTFKFGPAGSVDGSIDGGAGSNKLDYSGDGGSSVTVDLATGFASRIHNYGTDAFANIQALVGSSGYDALLGPNSNTTWTISGTNSGKAGTVSFSGFEELVGGSGVDVYKFTGSGNVGLISDGSAPAGTGDWLDYSALSTPVTVNLAAYSASRVGGGVGGRLFGIKNVRGGSGDDTLIGNGGNILIGGGGNDTITDAYTGTAASGRSLLIGGIGSDNLTAGAAGDLLISGATSYDTNNTALMGLLAEWQSSDSYATRFARLEGKQTGGLNGKYKLVWGSTVKDDATPDTLTGADGMDWFFANYPGNDIINNFDLGGSEYVNNSI